MSTKQWVWAIIIIIIILLALWYSGVFSSLTPAPATTQPAAVTTSVNSMAGQDSIIKTDVATLDMQIAAIGSGIAASTAPSKQQIGTIAANISAAAVTFNKLAVELRPRITNAQTAGSSVAGLQAALKDLATQVSNMTSQASAASKNVTTSLTSATITASFNQLKVAQRYANAARADIQTIVQGLNIK
ncbi:MAG: hypothetical protein ABSE76_02890 [Minisyncoccia bacterium]|jgi:hypothetical protein